MQTLATSNRKLGVPHHNSATISHFIQSTQLFDSSDPGGGLCSVQYHQDGTLAEEQDYWEQSEEEDLESVVLGYCNVVQYTIVTGKEMDQAARILQIEQ